jgi:phosphoribosylamine--glycine ligase
MKVLVIGGGGREHAIAWKLVQSPRVETVYCAPGNDGMAGVERLQLSDHGDLARFAIDTGIGLTMVGPEAPLCAGIVDTFRERGLAIVGPDARAARLEGSKSFAKVFMERYKIPTASSVTFEDLGTALSYVDAVPGPFVVKADGLAAGKGVYVTDDADQAADALRECFEGRFGDAGKTVVVEERLVGEEASIIALTDGTTVRALASSQDHKAVGEGDTGPNTGGMGAYSPAPVVTDDLMAVVEERILRNFLRGCRREGFDYRGVIYAGIMVTDRGPKVLEFNVRFGDPETQAILFRLDSDLFDLLLATAEGRLAQAPMIWSSDPAVCVVMASGGYPGAYDKGKVIRGLDTACSRGAMVFHAGTERQGDDFVTAGGRVLGVTARGTDLREAVDCAYDAVSCIHWDGAFSRRDIAHRALDRG